MAERAGAKVAKLREAHEWSLRALADAAGLDFSHVWKIEKGKRASLNAYVAVARALGVTVSDLFAERSRRAH